MHFWFLWATAAIWIAFILYWSASRCGAAPAATATSDRRRWIEIRVVRAAPKSTESDPALRESHKSRQIHQLLLWCAILLALLPGFPPLNREWLHFTPLVGAFGLTVQAAFAALYLWGRRSLGKHWSGAVRLSPGHELIRTGPYRWLRHPMYTAMLGMFLGTAIVSGEPHALLGLVIAVIAYGRKIRIEERYLREFFGEAYEDYRRDAWALIPGLV